MLGKEELKQAISEVLVSERTVSEAQHKLDHDFVQDRRKRFKIRAQRWEWARKTALGTVIVAVVGGTLRFLYWVGELAIHAFHNGQGPNQ